MPGEAADGTAEGRAGDRPNSDDPDINGLDDDFGPDEFDEALARDDEPEAPADAHLAAADGAAQGGHARHEAALGEIAQTGGATPDGAESAPATSVDDASHEGEPPGPGLSVVIIDGDAAHAAALHDALPAASGQRVEVVAVGSTAEEGLQAVDEHHPEVVVLGLNLAGGSLELLEKLLGNQASGKVVAVAGEDVSEAAEAAALGAHAVVSRTTASEHLLAPILGVVQGWRVLADPVVAELVAGARRPGAELLADLDDEAVQLWMLVAEGLDLPTIAARLELDESATKRKVSDLRTRVGASNRTQLASLAGRAGLVDDGWLDGSLPDQ